jgi:hypothetical protein
LAAAFLLFGARSPGEIFGASVSTTFSATGLALDEGAAVGAESVGFDSGLAAAFLAVFFAGATSVEGASTAGIAAFSFRATGASIEDEALLTNSPNSFSLATTTLLSTPSSLASS